MDMHRQGLSPRQIALRTGRTRNAVIGYIWRWKRRGGPPSKPAPYKYKMRKPPVPQHVVLRALADTSKEFGATNKARWIAMYLVSTSLDYGSTRAATAFDTSRNTLIRACNNVEDWRESPDLDEWIGEWEQKNSPGY